MKIWRNWLVFLVSVLFAAALTGNLPATSGPGNEAGECFTVLVGKNASADGSVMIAHNEDDQGDIIVNLRKIRAHDYGGPRKVALGGDVFHETDGKTAGFLWIEATTQEFADTFINEHGVVITSDGCPSRVTTEDITGEGLGWLLRLLTAGEATSAREAVRMAGGLVEKYGYRDSGRTYALVDKNEAWLLAVLRGRHWYAERVPDDEVAVIPNYFTIRGIRPEDTDNFMGSPDIIEFAVKNGLYDEAKDGPFDFKKAFDRTSCGPPVADGNSLRHWRGLVLLSGRDWQVDGDYPFSVRPAKKVTAEALMAVLRDHYEGTEYDATNGYKTGTPNRTKFRTICTSSTINAFVISLNRSRPDPISVALWLVLGKPDTTVFLPLYHGLTNLPLEAGLGVTTHDFELFRKEHFEDGVFKAGQDRLLRTKIIELEKAAEANYGPMRVMLEEKLFPAEKEFIKGRPEFEARFRKLYKKNRQAALKELDEYVASAFKKIGRLTAELLKQSPGD